MKQSKTVFIPYLLQSNIQKYYFARNKDMTFAKTFVSGLYPTDSSERSFKYSLMAENLLLYDTCYLSFDDFLYLLEKIEIKILVELMKTDVIRLIDTKNLSISCIFGMTKSEYVSLFTGVPNRDVEESLLAVLNKINSPEQFKKELLYWTDNKLKKDIDLDEIQESVLNESYKDLEEKRIRDYLDIDNMTGTEIKLDAYNNFKLNRVFFLNYSLQMGSLLGVKNIYNESVVSDLLNVKLGSYINSKLDEPNENFVKLLEFENLNDVNKLVSQKILTFHDILKIRESKNCIRFREWIHGNTLSGIITPQDKKDITTVYNEACKERKTIYNHKYSKVLRIGIPEVVGLFGGVKGTIASKVLQGVDFSINKLIRGWQPNIFIDIDLREYIDKRMNEQKIKDENSRLKKIYGSIGRDELCPCQSKIKYKKCHGRFGS